MSVMEAVPNWQGAEAINPLSLIGHYGSLHPLSLDHAESLYQAFSVDKAGKNWEYLPYGPFTELSAFKQWLASLIDKGDPIFYSILDQKDSRAMGLASYLRIDPIQGSIEVGHIHYSNLLQNTALATEAMFLMMAQAFKLGYRRYEWKCNGLNQPSRKAAQRLGFQYEGLFRQAGVMKGYNRDTAWFSIIDKEWEGLKAIYQQWLAPENFNAQGKQISSLSRLTHPFITQWDPILAPPQS